MFKGLFGRKPKADSGLTEAMAVVAKAFPITTAARPATVSVQSGNDVYDELIATYGGASYAEGLYRIHDAAAAQKWSGIIGEAYPTFRGRAFAFGQVWNGNQYAWVKGSEEQGLVYLFQISTGESFEVSPSILRTHDEELVGFAEETLTEELWNEWRASGGSAPAASQCVGFKKPVFLGGDDTVSNLELTDIEVYWDVTVQLKRQAASLPEGTKVDRILIEEQEN